MSARLHPAAVQQSQRVAGTTVSTSRVVMLVVLASLLCLVGLSLYLQRSGGVAPYPTSTAAIVGSHPTIHSTTALDATEIQSPNAEPTQIGSPISSSSAPIVSIAGPETACPSIDGHKAIPASIQGLADWGNRLAPPVCGEEKAESGWCGLEGRLLARPLPPATPNPTCDYEPIRQGNFTKVDDFTLWIDRFPSAQSPAFWNVEVTEAERERYWKHVPHAFDPLCHICRGDLAHPTLYSMRRWWKLASWVTGRIGEKNSDRKTSSATVLGMNADRLIGTAFSMNWNEPEGGDGSNTIESIPLDKVAKVLFCQPTDSSVEANVKIVTTNDVVHTLTFILPKEGLNCFWRSLQRLLPQLAKLAFVGCTADADGKTDPMPPTARFPYLPCYVFRLTEKMRICEKNHNYDRYKNHWPMKCEGHRLASSKCLPEAVQKAAGGQSDRSDQLQAPKVAVSLSGFLRTFEHARSALFERIVKPHNAEVFAATWNVVGRAKKFQPITKKDTLPLPKMHALVEGLIDQANKSSQRIEILPYHHYLKFHNVLQQNGFPHAGLYFTLSRSLKLVQESGIRFDIVIRTRFDVYPSVPLVFSPLPPSPTAPNEGGKQRSYVLDVGSSCKMQGAWWPQRTVLEPGKVLKHMADTRFKLFTWQVCDWIEIGHYDTMMKVANIFDWIVENNVFSGAQFVEHAFHIDQGIPYQPLQLYLKIMRARKKLFG